MKNCGHSLPDIQFCVHGIRMEIKKYKKNTKEEERKRFFEELYYRNRKEKKFWTKELEGVLFVKII